jgi:ATP-dependent Clp protease ATP-binding subunit ClpA
MLRKMKQRFNDMRTIRMLCEDAERHANEAGRSEPGVEHFVLAALALPDGTARKAFQRIGADPDQFQHAIGQQYADALKRIGIDVSRLDSIHQTPVPFPRNEGIYKAAPQVQTLMRQLADRTGPAADKPLLGAHVLVALRAFQQGVVLRSLKMMQVDVEALASAAETEIAAVVR